MASPTPQGISALLRKAGFQRSSASSGLRWRSSGYIVTKDDREGCVRVRYHFWSTRGGDAKPWLDRYAKTITEAGWTVEAGTYELIVTAKPASLLAAKKED